MRSRLRRLRIPAGGVLLLCLGFAATATAAAPAPDPPPLAVAPEAPQPEPAASKSSPAPVVRKPPVEQRAPVVTRTVVPPAPVVTRTFVRPVGTRAAPAKPAPAPAKKQPAVKVAAKPKPTPKPKPAAVVRTLPPHDRSPVPLATLIPSVEELDRGMLVLAGAGLAFVALGGAVVLLAARRELGELAR